MSESRRVLSLGARWAMAMAGCAWAVGASAQGAADSDAPPPAPGQVVSDVEPLPAEMRDSHGAVVIDGAPVRAQQKQERGATPVPPGNIGRNAANLVERNRSWDDVRDADAQEHLPPGEASGAGPR